MQAFPLFPTVCPESHFPQLTGKNSQFTRREFIEQLTLLQHEETSDVPPDGLVPTQVTAAPVWTQQLKYYCTIRWANLRQVIPVQVTRVNTAVKTKPHAAATAWGEGLEMNRVSGA